MSDGRNFLCVLTLATAGFFVGHTSNRPMLNLAVVAFGIFLLLIANEIVSAIVVIATMNNDTKNGSRVKGGK